MGQYTGIQPCDTEICRIICTTFVPGRVFQMCIYPSLSSLLQKLRGAGLRTYVPPTLDPLSPFREYKVKTQGVGSWVIRMVVPSITHPMKLMRS